MASTTVRLLQRGPTQRKSTVTLMPKTALVNWLGVNLPGSHPYCLSGTHRLHTRWALWFLKLDRSRKWQESLRLVTTFDTVEDFWAGEWNKRINLQSWLKLYNHINPPSKLLSVSYYCVFRNGIKPMWEDHSNNGGGRWVLTLAKNQRHSNLDNFWLETLLCLIGEGFGEHGADVCGAIVSIQRRADKIAVWTADSGRASAVEAIGCTFKRWLGLPSSVSMNYQVHADTATRCNSSSGNNTPVV